MILPEITHEGIKRLSSIYQFLSNLVSLGLATIILSALVIVAQNYASASGAHMPAPVQCSTSQRRQRLTPNERRV
jgi:hypothetical protein